ncbi:sodium-translocating pyrophosphatase [Chloroflexota bacterium]
MDPIYYAVIVGVLGLLFVAYLVRSVMATDQGTKRVIEISAAIKEGAIAFLHREYRILAIFVVIVAIVLGVIEDLGWWASLSFVFGAACSIAAGYSGMNIAVRANSRTAAAAKVSLNNGLKVAFRSGSVMGLTVVCIGILGLSIMYFAFHGKADFLTIIPAFGFGASAVALFARVGGGIFTKGADAAADLVGKVEKGIPEDDPRNPAVIAAFVGANVGDVAGMGADLFESYVDSVIAAIALSMVAVMVGVVTAADEANAWFLPMLIAASGIVASILGIFMVRVAEKMEMEALLGALRRGIFTASILVALFAIPIVNYLMDGWDVLWAIYAGLVAGILIGESTNYFTSYSYSPTKKISEACQTGAGTAVISGFANGLMSTLPPIIFVVIATLVAYEFASFYGIAIAAVGMLSTLGITLATDAYGPVADNAGGIVEMSDLPKEVRDRTDALDSLGNTTAATGKGFAIGSAALTALALMLSFAFAAKIIEIDAANNFVLIPVAGQDLMSSFLSHKVIVGLLIGAMLPAVFCAMTLNAAGMSAIVIIEEVRRQFREITGIMEGKAKPDYGRCVAISTTGALRKMIAPAVMAIVVPVLVGFALGTYALGGFLIGAISCGFILAVTMANAGGSWDNAKKWIETGEFGGKGSDAHKAGVIGDTVGDPMKDTAGPSLNIMLKLMSIIALVFAPVLANADPWI